VAPSAPRYRCSCCTAAVPPHGRVPPSSSRRWPPTSSSTSSGSSSPGGPCYLPTSFSFTFARCYHCCCSPSCTSRGRGGKPRRSGCSSPRISSSSSCACGCRCLEEPVRGMPGTGGCQPLDSLRPSRALPRWDRWLAGWLAGSACKACSCWQI
jgi:hypothetical protein